MNRHDKEVKITIPGAVQIILKRLELAGYEAQTVGGCVRDSLMGICPHDWDICTNAEPEAILLALKGMNLYTTGMKHGTITALIQGKSYEITTYRTDGIYLDGRHPNQVTFVHSLEDDLARRDFTINAMAYHPQRGLTDLFDGKKDIERTIIRCVGNPFLRFQEDALRIMRALRFSATLHFSIESKTAEAMHQNKNLLNRISAERVSGEFQIFLSRCQSENLMLKFSDIMEEIIPCTASLSESEKKEIYCLLIGAPSDFTVRLAALLCQVEDKATNFAQTDLSNIWNRLRYSNAVKRQVTLLLQYRKHLPANLYETKCLLGILGQSGMKQLIELWRILQKRSGAAGYDIHQLQAWTEDILSKKECINLKDMAVNGDDLKEAGMKEGKEIGECLHFLFEMILLGKIPNKKKELLKAAFLREPNQKNKDEI